MSFDKLSKEARVKLLDILKSNDKNDLEKLADIADAFDKKGYFEAANKLDGIIREAAKVPLKTYAQWLRHLKKMNCPARTLNKFKQTYKETLKKVKEKGQKDPENKALRAACKALPKKYCK